MEPNEVDRVIFKNRPASIDFLRERGIEIGDTQLAELATEERGPKYSLINGRALYRVDDLLNWIEAQASQPPRRASRRGRMRVPA